MIKVHVWKIIGISPLMQSNAECIEMNNNDALSVKKTYDDKDEAEKRLYKVDGKYCHLTSAFRRALTDAVRGRKFGSKQARYIISAAVFPVDEYCVICSKDGKPIKKYTIDKRSVVIKSGAKRNRIPRVRPKFITWTMLLPLEIDLELIQIEQVTEALNLAGRLIGIGEFRPDPTEGKSGIGIFGRFTAEFVK